MKHVSATIAAAGATAVIALGAFSTISVAADVAPDNPGHHYGEIKNGNNGHHYGQLKHQSPPPVPTPPPAPVPTPHPVTNPPSTPPSNVTHGTHGVSLASAQAELNLTAATPPVTQGLAPVLQPPASLTLAPTQQPDPLWWLLLALLPALLALWVIGARGVVMRAARPKPVAAVQQPA